MTANLIKKVITKLREDGVLALIKGTYRFVYNRYPQAIALTLVMILSKLGLIIGADRLAEKPERYSDSEGFDVAVHAGTPHRHLAEQTGMWRTTPQSVQVVEDVRIVGPHGLVFAGTGRLLLDEICNSRGMLQEALTSMISNDGIARTLYLLFQGMTGFRTSSHESRTPYFISMKNPHANNYFHWTVEHLPRLRAVEARGIDKECIGVLVENDAPGFVVESLELMGYSNVIECDKSSKQVNKLIVPDHRLRSRNYEFCPSPADLRWLRNCVRKELTGSNTGSKRRILILRSDTDSRRIVNRDELVACLAEYGFETQVMSELSVREQAKLFSQAEAIVAPHGAGLANIIYAESSKVIELYGGIPPESRYFTIVANELSHEYYSVDCSMRNRDIFVPMDEIRPLLEVALKTD